MASDKYLHEQLWNYGALTNHNLALLAEMNERSVNQAMERLKRQRLVGVVYLSDGTRRKIWYAKSSVKSPWDLPKYHGYANVRPSSILSAKRVSNIELLIDVEGALYAHFDQNREDFDYDILFPRRFNALPLPVGHQPAFVIRTKIWNQRQEKWMECNFYIEIMSKISSGAVLKKLAQSIQDRYYQYGDDVWPGRKTVIVCDNGVNLDRLKKILYRLVGPGAFYDGLHDCYRNQLRSLILRDYQ